MNTAEQDEINQGKLAAIAHIQRVRHFLTLMIQEMDHRAQVHDLSKLESPEMEVFGKYTPLLAKTEYGSEEYKELLKCVAPATAHHYSKNRHHPEHWPNGINDMTLIDLVEMLCDWRAATERNKNGNIRRSIEFNRDRYAISPQLARVMENTVREVFKE